MTANLLGQLTAFIVANISRRRTDHTRNGVLLHIFGHIDADHGVFVTEHGLGQCLAQLGLADTGRAEEQERTDRALRVAQADTAAADCLGNCGYSLALTDDTLMQRILEVQQTLSLVLGQLSNRNTGPAGDNGGNIVLGDSTVRLGLLVSPFLLCLLYTSDAADE